MPEGDRNSSIALKKLKKINDYKEALKGRLSVMRIQEEKSLYKIFLNEQKYRFHNKMRDETEK
jgi:hypothetical protein